MKLISRRKLDLAKFAKRARMGATEFLCIEGDDAYVTNGHYLIHIHEEEPSEDEFPEVADWAKDIKSDKYFIHPNTATKILKNLPKKAPVSICTHAALSKTKEGLSATVTDLENHITIKQRNEELDDDDFVDWKGYLTFDTKDPESKISVSFEYLKVIVTVISNYGSLAPVEMSFVSTSFQEKSAFYAKVSESEFSFLEIMLMPLRKN